ncbi:MAG: hypothetical protein ACRD8O_17790 [Bryobacteraceae bacterium]
MHRTAVALWLCLAATAASVKATTLTRASLDDLIEKSTAIVRGRVVSATPAVRGSSIYTAVRVQVIERWKGSQEGQVEVVVPGGTVGGMRETVTGAPELTAGAEYVLFLWTGPRNRVTQLLGLSQGVLDLITNAKGETLVVRSPVDATLVDPSSGKQVRQEPVQMRLSDFSTRVARTLAGGANR